MRSIAALGILLIATPVFAEDVREEAKRHFANGESFYRAADYKSAIAEFQAADKLVPSPILAFNMGLCHEKLGDGEQAVTLYRTYLERRPDAPNKAQVEARITRLDAELKTKKASPELYQELEDTPAAGTSPTGETPPGAAPAPRSDDPFVRRIPAKGSVAAAPAGTGVPAAPGAPSATVEGPPQGPPQAGQSPPQGPPQSPPPEPEKPA